MKQMVEAFEQTGSSILGSEVVEGDAIQNYGCLDCTPDPTNPRLLAVKNMVEKPKPAEAPSQNAIIGRYILTPRIFSLLEQVTPGAGGELQLTDGIKALLAVRESLSASPTKASATTPATSSASSWPPSSSASNTKTSAPKFRDFLKSFPF